MATELLNTLLLEYFFQVRMAYLRINHLNCYVTDSIFIVAIFVYMFIKFLWVIKGTYSKNTT